MEVSTRESSPKTSVLTSWWAALPVCTCTSHNIHVHVLIGEQVYLVMTMAYFQYVVQYCNVICEFLGLHAQSPLS